MRLPLMLLLVLLAVACNATEIAVADKYSAGALAVGDTTTFTGVGGVQASSVSIGVNGRLVLDPVRTPIKVNGAVALGAGARLALAPAHRMCTRGRFILVTFSGTLTVNGVQQNTIGATVANVFDETCLEVADAQERVPPVVKLERAADGSNKQLVLTVGDYDANAPTIRVMPLGDSITEGTNQYNDYARSNYRLPLMAKLEAVGFKAISVGYATTCNQNSAGIVGPLAHQTHAARSGQACRTVSSKAGWEDSIEATLDAAGEPDFVTFKIGTNDLGGQGADSTFNAWSNVVWRILRARPNTKVVVTTIVNKGGGPGVTANYNEKIRAYMAKENLVAGDEGFPTDRVFFVDVCSRLSEMSDFGNDGADGCHPSWRGHDKVSSTFFDAITNVYEKTKRIAPAPVAYTTTSGVAANVPVAYRRGFKRIGRIAITTGLKLANIDYSDFDAELAAKTYSRVAYYMELKRRNTDFVDYHGHRRFVWADMDAFGSRNWTAVQFPKTAKQQRVVDNLHVYSNDTGIRCIPADRDGEEGFIEFWPFAYGGDASGIAGAPAHLYTCDWNDTTSGSGGYGSFQVHRKFKSGDSWNAGEVLMAFNRWNASGNNEIGIGSFAQQIVTQSADYTYTSDWAQMSSAAYEDMFIEIWAREEFVDVAKLGGIEVRDGYDYTNAVVNVSVQECNPSAEGAKLIVTARKSTGETVATQERALTTTGDYTFDFGGLVPGGAYVFEVTATNDDPVVAFTVDAAKVGVMGHLASTNAWFKADGDGVVNGAWDSAPVYVEGRAEVGKGAGLRFGIDRKADDGKLTVVDSVVEFNTAVPDEELAALDLSGCQSAITPVDDDWKAWNGSEWIALNGRKPVAGRWTVRTTYDYSGLTPRVSYAVKRDGDSSFTQLRTGDGDYWFACGNGGNAKKLSGVDYRCGGWVVAHEGNYHENTTASSELANGTEEKPVQLYTNVTWPGVKSGTYYIDRNGYELKFVSDQKVYPVYGPGDKVTIRLGDGLVVYLRGKAGTANNQEKAK